MFRVFFFVKLIISKRPEQVNLGGERQNTPLHYAALTDNLEAAQILVSIYKRFFFDYHM
jgi:ankyrin repeat protein